jgi:hypothetical protein
MSTYEGEVAEEVEQEVRRLTWDTKVHMTHAEFASACKFAAWMGWMAGMVTAFAIVMFVLAVR